MNYYGRGKVLLIMKLTLVLLISFSLALHATGFGQKITLNVKNESIEKVLGTLEKQTSYRFLYRDDALKNTVPVSLNIKHSEIETVLNELFKGQGLAYEIIAGTINVIAQKPIETIRSAAPIQQKQLTGNVKNGLGEPLVGVSVRTKNANKETSTDESGLFAITVDPNDVLVFSYVGFVSQEVQYTNQTSLNIELVEENTAMDEIVVIGYGQQKKLEVTSAVANVNSKDFVQGSVKDVGQLLQGKVAGLAINNVSGDPSAPSQILLRGVSTLYSSTAPLILIDGIPGDLSTVMPNDIESVDVLKDGSAAAIYGTRGTNGVILINTKKAEGKSHPVLTYNGYLSTQEFVRLPRILTASEYREKIADGVPFSDLGASTDWVKELTKQKPISQNHELSISGGNSSTNYYGNINYRDLKGLVLQTELKTFNARMRVNHSMFDEKLKISLGVLANENNSEVDFDRSSVVGIGDGGTSGDFINQAFIRNPTEPVINPDGTWYENTVLFSFNPVGILKETFGGSKYLSNRINGSITWEPIDNLRFKALGFRGNYRNRMGLGQTKAHVSNNKGGTRNGFANESSGQSIDNLLELTTDYTKSFNSHNITTVAGYSYQDNTSESSSLTNYDFPAGNFSYLDNIGLGQALLRGEADMGSSKYTSNLIGFFGRVNYNYQEKYLLMGSLRYEGSSKLVGTDKPWGLFPAISGGWRISEEEFMAESIFSDLKLRVGYGITGTAPGPHFLGVALLGYSSQIFYDGKWVPALSPISNPNPSLRWERKKETNIGLDIGILKGRFSASIDLYDRTTDGLLYSYSVPTPPNAYGTTVANVGVMKNKGLEALLTGTLIQSDKISWNSTATFSTNTNELVSISNDLYQTTQNWFNTGSPRGALNSETYTHRVEVGKPIGNFFGHKVIDINENGKWIYEDKNGEPTTDRLEENKKVIGNGLPKYYASLNNYVRYGNFDLNLNMRSAFGFDVLNSQRMNMENPNVRLGNNQLKSAYDKVFGKAILSSGNTSEYNSYYVEKGDFLKIDNISIGYNLKSLKNIPSARIYFSVLNAFVLTSYKGMDPEVPVIGLSPGIDHAPKYPATRVYSLGFNITIN